MKWIFFPVQRWQQEIFSISNAFKQFQCWNLNFIHLNENYLVFRFRYSGWAVDGRRRWRQYAHPPEIQKPNGFEYRNYTTSSLNYRKMRRRNEPIVWELVLFSILFFSFLFIPTLLLARSCSYLLSVCFVCVAFPTKGMSQMPGHCVDC